MQKWFKSVFLFSVCFVFGFLSLIFMTPKDKLVSQELELSSMAAAKLYRYDFDTSTINEYELAQNLNQLNSDWYNESYQDKKMNYVYTPEQLKTIEDIINSPNPLPLPTATQYEDVSSCTTSRMWVEKDISNHPDLKDLIEERTESNLIPRSCVTYTMNNFNLGPQNHARCPTRGGLPLPGGAKPCSTKNLVNLTYNTYVDVMDCFGFKPKNILPKLSNESGMVLNTLGGGFDAGVAQMTITGINFVNAEYAQYIAKMQVSPRPACVRLMKHKNLLTQASELKKDRCGFISPAENPLRSFVYSAVLNKINETEIKRLFDQNNIEARLVNLGFKNIDIDSLIEVMAYMSYNAGSDVAFNSINTYVTKREANRVPTSAADFNFFQQRTALDMDGTEKDVHAIARAFVASPLKFPGDTDKIMAFKLKRSKLLPEKIRSAYKLSFPEYLIYKQNNFNEADQTIGAAYRMMGSPGYIGFLAKKNNMIRAAFNEFGLGADYCSNPNYLKISK
jgi:hypothetical protein